jgi:hypothetical protein
VRVFYYRWTDGRIYMICARGLQPGRKSPVWGMPGACVWMVPELDQSEEEDE